jgi:hypothetical protein
VALFWAAQGEAAGKAHAKTITEHSIADWAMPAIPALQERKIDVSARSTLPLWLMHRFAPTEIIVMQIAAFESSVNDAAAIETSATARRRWQ